jgi:hypothetical protein
MGKNSKRAARTWDPRTGRPFVSKVEANKARQAAQQENGNDLDADDAFDDEDVSEIDEVNYDDHRGVFDDPYDVVAEEDDPQGDENAAAEDRPRPRQGETENERAHLHTAVDDLDSNETAVTKAPKAVRKRSGAEAEKQVRQDRQR